MNLRYLALFILPVLSASYANAQNDTPVFIVKNEPIAPPAAPGSSSPHLVNAADGTVYLSWLEPAPDRRIAFRFSRFDAATRTWSPARTIGEGLATDVPRDQAPLLSVTDAGHLAALWYPTTALTLFSTSADGGANWTTPIVLNRPKHLATDATLQSLPNGQLLAAWIEPNAGANALLARAIAPKAEAALIDPSVSPGCAPALVPFPDGSALLAYRGLTADGMRDILTARFHDGQWTQPTPLINDHWKPAAPPHDGPALVVRGVHVSAAWFTVAEDARVNVSTSDNAGAQWLMANRVDDVAPLGRPGLVLFDDGSQLVSWVEIVKGNQVVLLRRISARGNLSVPVQLGPVANDTTPSIARVKDGDATPAQILVAFIHPPDPSFRTQVSALDCQLSTFIITLPSVVDLSEADPCGCDPRPEDLRGYPIQGRILSIEAARYTLQLEHGEILGVMKAGVTTVEAGPEVLRAVRPGRTILARIERDGASWSLFAVRVLGDLKN